MLAAVGGLTGTRWLIRQGWEKVAAEYAKNRLGIFGRFAGRLLDLLHPLSGSTLLDVGTGATALPAAAWVGSGGWVTGSHIAAAMVPLVAQAAEEHGMTSATFCQMSAAQSCFPGGSFPPWPVPFLLSNFQIPHSRTRDRVRVSSALRPG